MIARADVASTRWFQYRLRTLLAAIAVLCLPLAWLAWRIPEKRRERAAVSEIQAWGGWVSYDYEIDEDGAEVAGSEPTGPAWLRRLCGDDFFATPTAVDLDRTSINDSHLVLLEVLIALEALDLSDTQITDAGLHHIKSLASLKSLSLAGTPITGSGLAHLKGMTEIREAFLGGSQMSDFGLANLKGLTNLKHLDLRNTNVTETGIAELQRDLPLCEIIR